MIRNLVEIKVSFHDANLFNTRPSNPHAKTSNPRKPSKSSLIGV